VSASLHTSLNTLFFLQQSHSQDFGPPSNLPKKGSLHLEKNLGVFKFCRFLFWNIFHSRCSTKSIFLEAIFCRNLRFHTEVHINCLWFFRVYCLTVNFCVPPCSFEKVLQGPHRLTNLVNAFISIFHFTKHWEFCSHSLDERNVLHNFHLFFVGKFEIFCLRKKKFWNVEQKLNLKFYFRSLQKSSINIFLHFFVLTGVT
jgi:hypothetical protein